MIGSERVSHQLSCWHVLFLALVSVALFGKPVQADDEESIPLDQCPPAVQKRIKAEAGDGGRIKEVEKESHEGTTLYEAEIVMGDDVYEVLVRENGVLLAKVLEQDDEDGDDDADDDADDDDADDDDADDGDDDEEEEMEEAVKLSELPAAVRKTLEREAKGGELEELERETEDGHVVYSAEVEYETDAGELVYEIEIAESGQLLSKVLEQEDDDDDEADDDDEEEEEEDDDR